MTLKHHRVPPALLSLLSLLIFVGGLHGQDHLGLTTAEAIETATPRLLEIAAVEQQLAAVEAADLDQLIKDALKVKFTTATQSLNQAATNRQREASFRSVLASAPVETEASKHQLESLLAADDAAQVEAIDNIEALRKEVETRHAALAILTTQLSEAEKQLARVRRRPVEIATRLPTTRSELTDLDARLVALKSGPDDSFSLTAERMILQAQHEALATEIAMLLAEQLSQAVREHQRLAQRDLSKALNTNAKAALTAYEENLQQQLADDALRLQLRVEQLIKRMVDPDKKERELLAQLKSLTGELRQSTTDLEEASHRQMAMQEQLELLDRNFTSLGEQIELGGLKGQFSHYVMEQRRGLPNSRAVSYSIKTRREALSDLRLISLRTDKKLQDQDMLRKDFKAQAKPALAELFDIRREILQKLLKNYRSQIRTLALLDSTERAYLNKIIVVRSYLDSKLFWLKSSPPIDASFFKDLPGAFRWVLNREHLSQGVISIRSALHRYPVELFAALLASIILLVLRPKTIKLLKLCGQKTLRISTDNYRQTLMALGYSILLALPIPLLFITISWAVSSDPSESDWVRGMSRGLLWVSVILMASNFFRALSRHGGLGEIHFRWNQKRMCQLRKAFSAITLVYLPSLLIISTTLFDQSARHFDSLGRLFFIISHLWVGLMFAKALWYPEKNVDSTTKSSRVLAPSLRALIRLLVICVPFAMALLAAIGFLNTAIALSLIYLTTLGIMILGLFVYSISLRWFMIKERRLIAEKMIEERRASREAAKASDHPETISDLPPIAADDVDLDLDVLGGQIRRLLSSLLLVGTVVCLCWFWYTAIPFGGGMEKLSLGSGLTLFSLLRAGLIAWIGTTMVRNLPGLIELSGLRNSAMDSGTRYAVVTIAQYAITALTAVLVFHQLNLDWSKFGWIAAALSVGLGFGLQEVVANFVCGIILLFERPIRVGDVVVVDGVSGVVSRIRMRATTITSWDREDLVVPNKAFITGSLINCTLSSSVNRVMISVGVAYGSDIPAALRILSEVAEANRLVLTDPAPFTSFEEFGDSSLHLVLRCYLPNRDNRLHAISQLHSEIDRRFKLAKIKIPFPQRDIHIKEQLVTDRD